MVITEICESTKIEHFSYKCTYPNCAISENFKSVKLIKEHLEQSHLNNAVYRPYKCIECNADFTLPSNLKSHQKTKCKVL